MFRLGLIFSFWKRLGILSALLVLSKKYGFKQQNQFKKTNKKMKNKTKTKRKKKLETGVVKVLATSQFVHLKLFIVTNLCLPTEAVFVLKTFEESTFFSSTIFLYIFRDEWGKVVVTIKIFKYCYYLQKKLHQIDILAVYYVNDIRERINIY